MIFVKRITLLIGTLYGLLTLGYFQPYIYMAVMTCFFFLLSCNHFYYLTKDKGVVEKVLYLFIGIFCYYFSFKFGLLMKNRTLIDVSVDDFKIGTIVLLFYISLILITIFLFNLAESFRYSRFGVERYTGQILVRSLFSKH